MIVTIKELNAFAILLEYTSNKALFSSVREKVLEMVKNGVTEMDINVDSPEDQKVYDLIKQAESVLRYKNQRRNNNDRTRKTTENRTM